MRAPSLAGRLEDIPLPELLQFLSANDKTGRLSLSRREGDGLVVLKEGRIVYAASSSIRETFGNILLCRGLISEPTLMEAIERQHWPGEAKRLGAILVEMGGVRPEDLVEVMRQQIEGVLLELARWPSGFFRFDAMPVPQQSEIEVDAQDFLITDGVSTDRVLIELVTRLDEAEEAAVPVREIVTDLRAPTLRGEITVMLMRYASKAVKRGVLFAVRGDSVGGIAHFGFSEEGAEDRIRSLSFPLQEPSLFSEVVQKKETYRGPLPAQPASDRLAQQLGGPRPREVVLIPVVMAGSAAMVFYGDDAPSGEPLGPTQGLEELLREAGLGMEKEALEERIRDFERSRRR